jgi:cysteine-rich repeat protein
MVGGLIAACHSGDLRDLSGVEQSPTPSAPNGAGSDASPDGSSPESNEAGLAGGGGNDGTGGDGGSTPPTAGGDGNGGNGDIPDGGDAEVEAGRSCGDGHTDLALDEECDDGNDRHSDGCEIDCKKTRIVQMAMGVWSSCALSSGGGVKCWGGDNLGALGRGTTGADVPDPTQIDVIDFGTSRRVTQLVGNWSHYCVVFEDERARCWGGNPYGQLGIGTLLDYGDDLDEPLNALPDLPITGVKEIAVSGTNTCVISDAAGTNNLYCWGVNGNGTLGIGSTADKSTADTNDPAQLNAEPQQITLGFGVPCVIYGDGLVRCFGSYYFAGLGCGLIDFDIGNGIGDGNGLGELPDNPLFDVKGLPGPAHAITGNTSTFCALIVDQLYCWGQNWDAQTGQSPHLVSTKVWEAMGPVNLGDVSVMQAAVARAHGCALDDHGVVRCWGSGEIGQEIAGDWEEGALGYPGHRHVGLDREPVLDYQLMSGFVVDGGPTDAAIPGAESLPLGAVDVGDFDGIAGLDPVEHVWIGYRATCVLIQNGGVRCWGKNDFNRLGYGIAIPNIGYTQSPAELYAEVGFSDIRVFEPPP